MVNHFQSAVAFSTIINRVREPRQTIRRGTMFVFLTKNV